MSETNGRLDYSRLVSDIDFASAFEGTRFEEYTDSESEGGVGSVIGGWLGAIIGRFVGMALGQVAQELLVEELFGSKQADETADEADSDDSDEESTDASEKSTETEESETDEEPAEADAE